MIKLTPMTPSHLEQVITLSVADEQLPYVGTVEQVLLNADDKVHPHLVMDDDKVVGIFLIDTTYSLVYDFAPSGSLGFRAFFDRYKLPRSRIWKRRNVCFRQLPSATISTI